MTNEIRHFEIVQTRAKISDALDNRNFTSVADYLEHLHTINPKAEYGKALSILERPTGIIDNLDKMGLSKDSPIFQEFQRYAIEKEKELSKIYDEVQSKASQAKTAEELMAVSAEFWQLGDYRDSLSCAKIFRDKAKQVEWKRKRVKIASISAAILAVTIIVLTWVISNAVTNANNFREGTAYLEAGNYARAAATFGQLGDYRDSIELERSTRFRQAEELFADQQFEEAARIFSELGNFSNAAERANESSLQFAEKLFAAGNLVRAFDVLIAIGNDRNIQQRTSELMYEIAESFFATGYYIESASAFSRIENFSNANERLLEAAQQAIAGRVVLAAGENHVVGLMQDGTVVAAGLDNQYGKLDVSGWRNIVSVAAGGSHTVGLRSDGTVVATGLNNRGQCDVSEWSDIVSISAGSTTSFGLRANGTVIASEDRTGNVSGWRNIVAISAGATHVVGLRADGTVVSCSVFPHDNRASWDWYDIVAIAANRSLTEHIYGLKPDGTVVTTFNLLKDRSDILEWGNIASIAAGPAGTLGLQPDGSLMRASASLDDSFEGRIYDLSNVAAVAMPLTGSVFAPFGRDGFFVLTANGSVLALGEASVLSESVSNWRLW